MTKIIDLVNTTFNFYIIKMNIQKKEEFIKESIKKGCTNRDIVLLLDQFCQELIIQTNRYIKCNTKRKYPDIVAKNIMQLWCLGMRPKTICMVVPISITTIYRMIKPIRDYNKGIEPKLD